MGWFLPAAILGAGLASAGATMYSARQARKASRLNAKTGQQEGQHLGAMYDTAFPGTTAWERLGSPQGASGAAGSIAQSKAQSKIAKMQALNTLAQTGMQVGMQKMVAQKQVDMQNEVNQRTVAATNAKTLADFEIQQAHITGRNPNPKRLLQMMQQQGRNMKGMGGQVGNVSVDSIQLYNQNGEPIGGQQWAHSSPRERASMLQNNTKNMLQRGMDVKESEASSKQQVADAQSQQANIASKNYWQRWVMWASGGALSAWSVKKIANALKESAMSRDLKNVTKSLKKIKAFMGTKMSPGFMPFMAVPKEYQMKHMDPES